MKKIGSILGLCLLAVSTATANASEASDCAVALISANADGLVVNADASYGEYNLTIENRLSVPVGGLIVSYQLLADDRPTPLAKGYAESVHTLSGALLPGEVSVVGEVIVLSDHASNVAASVDAGKLKVVVRVLAVADVDSRPFGGGDDPYAIWSDQVSQQVCKAI